MDLPAASVAAESCRNFLFELSRQKLSSSHWVEFCLEYTLQQDCRLKVLWGVLSNLGIEAICGPQEIAVVWMHFGWFRFSPCRVADDRYTWNATALQATKYRLASDRMVFSPVLPAPDIPEFRSRLRKEDHFRKMVQHGRNRTVSLCCFWWSGYFEGRDLGERILTDECIPGRQISDENISGKPLRPGT